MCFIVRRPSPSSAPAATRTAFHAAPAENPRRARKAIARRRSASSPTARRPSASGRARLRRARRRPRPGRLRRADRRARAVAASAPHVAVRSRAPASRARAGRRARRRRCSRTRRRARSPLARSPAGTSRAASFFAISASDCIRTASDRTTKSRALTRASASSTAARRALVDLVAGDDTELAQGFRLDPQPRLVVEPERDRTSAVGWGAIVARARRARS